jgi:hypothetical protein
VTQAKIASEYKPDCVHLYALMYSHKNKTVINSMCDKSFNFLTFGLRENVKKLRKTFRTLHLSLYYEKHQT